MRYAVTVPQFGPLGDVRALADLARDAEKAGWDAFFVWDHILFDNRLQPMVDPWVALAAIAMTTTHIRIGAMVTPLARRRPWKLARETASIDQLSGGRLVVGVGLGDPPGTEFEAFGEDPDPRVRAGKLDEGLDVLTGLWGGRPFSYSGAHYRLKDVLFTPRPVQTPRIPIWVAGTWPNRAPMRRAARWDGAFPQKKGAFTTLEDWREILEYLRRHLTDDRPFDLVQAGATAGMDQAQAVEIVAPFAELGITWWVEDVSPWSFGWDYEGEWPTAAMVDRVRAGPPRLDG